MVRITKLVNNLNLTPYKLMAKAGKQGVGVSKKPVPIEIQMIPKYLELASYRGRDRFNFDEINEITNLIKERKSRGISPTDLIKTLLDIGKDNGNILSAREIKDFFEATFSGYKRDGQQKILRFMKSLKEGQKPPQKSLLGLLSDNKSFCEGKPNSTSDFVSFNNRLYTKTISESERPEILARVAEITGNHDKYFIAASANTLAELYELTNGNAALILDCNRAFPSWKIVQIIKEIKRPDYKLPQYDLPRTQPKYALEDHSSYTAEQQAPVLEALNIKYRIYASDFDYKYVDAMNSRVRLSGNFEGGKRR